MAPRTPAFAIRRGMVGNSSRRERKEEPSERERMDPADSSLAVDSVHHHGDRQLRADRHGQGQSAELDHLFAAAPARLVAVHRVVPLRPSLYHQGKGGTKKRAGHIKTGDAASKMIDKRVTEVGGWRGETLERIRALIKAAVPDVIEEWKWETPVWSHEGIICTGETYKAAVKMTFPKGASLADPKRLFNSSLEGATRRAIDIHEGEKIDEAGLKTLFRAAAALNTSGKKR